MDLTKFPPIDLPMKLKTAFANFGPYKSPMINLVKGSQK